MNLKNQATKKAAVILAVGFGFYLTSKESSKCIWPFNPASESALSPQQHVWIWGNGVYTPQPDFKTQFLNFTPKEKTAAVVSDKSSQKIVDNFPRFKNIAFSDEKVYMISQEGNLYSFENTKMDSFLSDRQNIKVGSASLHPNNLLINFEQMNFPKKVKKVGVTKKFVWGLAENGQMFTFALENNKDKKWDRVENLSEIEEVSFGENHLLLLNKTGELYSMGDDAFGQCGNGPTDRSPSGPFLEQKIQKPKQVKIPGDKKISKIFSKSNHNFVITTENEVFCFGKNHKMQLGFEDEFANLQNPLLAIYSPRSFQSYIDMHQCDLQDIILGEDFSLFNCVNKSTQLTEVFGMGPNYKGQMAMGYEAKQAHFSVIDSLSNLSMTKDGIESPMRIKKISCGDRHCLASFEQDGLNLTWGDNENGQIGNQTNLIAKNPKLITVFKDKKVLDILADKDNSYVLTE